MYLITMCSIVGFSRQQIWILFLSRKVIPRKKNINSSKKYMYNDSLVDPQV